MPGTKLYALEQIGKCLVGQHPGRFEPRVRKKRGSNYNLMMQPREQLRARLLSEITRLKRSR
ncbi:hypothetical protein SAMN06265222_101548 [Neorhodopirellula lusitana]|uniref:Uncharacterized protein n=1 Tax=Neorhodopirellula lusitana TaxID=445327 RepID=A0ABY1PPE6_9BACT|nr:hypothetical protein [Neorhodopirellula lusitana]SMP41207.1 hypothetical protein SAMN06265222_101548 [Neorhodopirellula lusitana]